VCLLIGELNPLIVIVITENYVAISANLSFCSVWFLSYSSFSLHSEFYYSPYFHGCIYRVSLSIFCITGLLVTSSLGIFFVMEGFISPQL
jgi:hypothetical protein